MFFDQNFLKWFERQCFGQNFPKREHMYFFFKKLRFTPYKAEQPPEAWGYKKKKHKKAKAYRKCVWKEPTDKRYLLILDLKPVTSYVKGKHSMGREM